jgi:phosphoglycolate phosphatase
MWRWGDRGDLLPITGAKIGAFIFDLDGTLVDSGLDIARSANFVRAHFGLPELAVATAQSYVGDGVSRLLLRTLGHDQPSGRFGDNGLPVSESRLAEAMAVFRDHYATHLLDHTSLYSGTREVLAQLDHVPLHVATNKPRDFTERILAALGLAGVFRRVVGGDEPMARKPDPAHLVLTLADLDIKPHQVVMVGDSPNDVNAAKAFGAISVGCTYGLVAPEVVAASKPDYLINSITALPELFAV